MELKNLENIKETLEMLLDFNFIESIEEKIESSLKDVNEAINFTHCCETFDCGDNRVNGYVKCLEQCDECKECYR